MLIIRYTESSRYFEFQMESEAGQDIFSVLQGDGCGTKIGFISFILLFLYFSLMSHRTVGVFFLFEELCSLGREEY